MSGLFDRTAGTVGSVLSNGIPHFCPRVLRIFPVERIRNHGPRRETARRGPTEVCSRHGRAPERAARNFARDPEAFDRGTLGRERLKAAVRAKTA